MQEPPELIRLERITKRFPGVVANDDVSMTLRAGEVHALLGENGAGKTTLMKVLCGLHRPDVGRILLGGVAVDIDSAKTAARLGISMVHQHFMLVPALTGVENVVLGLRPLRPPLLDLSSAATRLRELADAYGLDVDPRALVEDLPLGAQQRLEILKALFRDAQVLVLDEPTAVLAPAEVDRLFQVVNRLVAEGRSVIFISHKLDEVKRISHRITVLRQGRAVGTVPAGDATPSQLAALMLGRDAPAPQPREAFHGGEVVFEVRNLSCLDDRGIPALSGISFTVRAGQVLGVAGVDGNGQRELAECAAGLRAPSGGSVTVAGVRRGDTQARSQVVGFIPEDRQKTGLVPAFSVAENLVLRDFGFEPYARRRMLHWRAIEEHARTLMARFGIHAAGPDVPVRTLSGGHQQRVVIARETDGARVLIVAAQPTRGLDVGAVDAVHRLLLDARARGTGILYISTELGELLSICDRVLVLYRGQIMGEVPADPDVLPLIGEMMMGRRHAAA